MKLVVVVVFLVLFLFGGLMVYVKFSESFSREFFGGLTRPTKQSELGRGNLDYIFHDEKRKQNIESLDTSASGKFTKTLEKKKLDRIAVVCYIGESHYEVQTFLTMLYGSWRYINENRDEIVRNGKIDLNNDIDIVSFCLPNTCNMLKAYCNVIDDLSSIKVDPEKAACWAVKHTIKIPIPYPPLNSYVMFVRPDIKSLTKHYKYLLRTDYDVFISPQLFTFKTNEKLLFGTGGYSVPFSINRLRSIAKKLGLTHRGVINVGSTWFGQTEFFIKAAKKAYNITIHFYVNEFKINNPEISMYFKKNSLGTWPQWWRPVSTMYAGELTVNDMITDVSIKNRGKFDGSSCGKENIMKSLHIHCWHNDCEFQKFKFKKFLNMAVDKQNGIPGPVVHGILENTYKKNITGMTLYQYSTYIAWHSAGKYMREWFVKQ